MRRTIRAALLAAALSAALTADADAAPGRYTQYLGALPDGTPTPAGPWVATGVTGGFNHGAPAGGSFGIEMPADTSLGWSRAATLSPPPALSFASALTEREFSAPVSGAVYQPQVFTTWENRGALGSTYGGDGSALAVLTAPNPASLSAEMRCSNPVGGSDPYPRCIQAGYWRMARVELAVDDASPPVGAVDGAGGDLLDGSWQTVTTASATVRGSDTGAGVYRFFLREGPTTIYAVADPASTTCRDARPNVGSDYEFGATTSSLVPCDTADRPYAPEFSIADLGDGTHTGVVLGIEDASGRETVIDAGRTLRVNAPGGTLGDPGASCTNGAFDETGSCIARPPSISASPVLSGTPSVSGSLTTDTGTWNDVAGATITYAWELCDAGGGACSTIPGEHGAALLLTAAMVDRSVRSVVTATTSGGTVSSRSAPSYAIAGAGGSAGAGGAGGVHDVLEPPSSAGGSASGGRPSNSALPLSPIVVTVARPNGHGAESAARVVAERHGSAVTGRLTTGRGEPISDAQIDVIVQAAVRGAHGQIGGAVTTDEDGRFTFRLSGGGGARIFTFGYREHLSDDHYTDWTSVTANADAVPPTLTVDRTRVVNGQSVLFRGTATDPVDLQVLTRGRWTTIATPHPRDGAFNHRYRFTRTRRTQTYRFRATAPGGTSTTTTVRVTAKETR